MIHARVEAARNTNSAAEENKIRQFGFLYNFMRFEVIQWLN